MTPRGLMMRVGIGLVAAVALVAAAVVLVFFVLMPAHFHVEPPAKNVHAALDPLQAQREDFAYFRSLTRLDRSFSSAARVEAERLITEHERANTVLSRPQMRVALMRIAALADNGHTRIGYEPGADPMELPVRVKGFQDGFFIMRADADNSDLLGARIIAIDGQPIADVVHALMQLRGGGTPGWRQLWAERYLSWQDLLVGLAVAPDMHTSTWTVQTPDGAVLKRTLVPYLPLADEPFGFPVRWYSSEALEGLPQGWRAFQPAGELPLAWRDFDVPFRRGQVADSCAMWVQLKSNADEGRYRIGEFLEATRAEMRARRPCNLVLDLRYDTGGDYTSTATFARALPSLLAPDGHIYMLVSPGTFSAGITTTAFVKQAGGDRVTILGEPIGDRLVFYSEGGRGCLPNVQFCLVPNRQARLCASVHGSGCLLLAELRLSGSRSVARSGRDHHNKPCRMEGGPRSRLRARATPGNLEDA